MLPYITVIVSRAVIIIIVIYFNSFYNQLLKPTSWSWY